MVLVVVFYLTSLMMLSLCSTVLMNDDNNVDDFEVFADDLLLEP